MTVSNEMLSSTLHIIRDQEVDALFKASPLLDRYRSIKGAIKFESGGNSIRVPVVTAEHATLTAHVDGLETLNTGVRDVLNYSTFEWADMSAPIVISKKEALENSGDKAIIKLAEAKLRSVMATAKRTLHRHLLVGDNAIAARAGLNTLYGHSTVKTNGFIEGAAVGSQTNTIGTLAKSASLKGWDNQFYDCGDDFSANGLVGLTDLWIKSVERSVHGAPNLLMMSQAGMRNYKAAIQPQERYVDGAALDAGRMSLMFNGAPVESTEDMATSATNDQEFTCLMLNLLSIPLVIHEEADFAVSDWSDLPITQAGRGCQFYLKLQLTDEGTASNGVLVDGNTI